MIGQPTGKPSVLIVEDNEDVRRVVKLYLESHGYRVVEAGDGVAGLAAFDAERPDLILLDVLLPRLDGIEALRRLRNNPLGRDVPVIVMSAVLQTKDLMAETAQLRVAALLQKPFQVRRLLEEVRRVLSGPAPAADREEPSSITVLSGAGSGVREERVRRVRNEPFAISAVGNLEKTPLPKVLHSLFTSNRTGRLRIVAGTTEKRIYVASGLPVYAESSIPEETLGAYLVSKNIITEEQQTRARIEMNKRGRQFGDALLKLNIISPHQLFTEMELHLAEKIVSTFSWKKGLFRFEDDESWKDDVVIARMKPARILLDGVQRFWTAQEVLASERFTLDSRTFVVEEPPYPDDQMALTPAEAKLVQLARRNQTIREIAAATGLDGEKVVPTVYALWVMERIGFYLATDRPSAPPPEPAAEGAARAGAAAQKAPSSSREELVQALLAEYLKLKTVDYFTLLGVARGATKEEIDTAFAARQKRYHPDNLVGIGSGLVHDKMEELFVRVHTAHRTLTDAELRSRYERELDQGAKRTMLTHRSKTGRFETLSNKPRHELLFEDGFSLLRNGEFTRALPMFEEAERLVAKPRYAAYRIWCAYLVNPKLKESAERDLVELQRTNGDDSIMPYLLGNLYLKEGNEQRATACFERVLEIDPQNIDAARQLRIIRMRQRTKSSESSGLFDLFRKS